MIQIKPVSELRNNFASIEKIVEDEELVFLTKKNGYGKVVVISIGEFAKITDKTEVSLYEADVHAQSLNKRLSHSEVFDSLKKIMKTL